MALFVDWHGYKASYYDLLTILDIIFSAVIVCPCVVTYWRSAWGLMDIYTQNLSSLASACISTCIGLMGHGIFTIWQKELENNFHPSKHRILFYAISRIYTACFAFVCINGWRGPWNILDICFKNDRVALFATVTLGILALLCMKGIRNVTSPPFVIVNDDAKGYFEVSTMCKTGMGERTSLYVLDCLFSILVVGTLVVFVWRGVWQLIDIFLFPNDENFSSWSSLVLGYLVVASAFLLQPLMKYLCERLTGTARLLIADVFVLYALFGTVNVWRGIWNLLNIYFLPDNLELSCWITHWVSLIILILCRCSNSLLVRGVYIDAEEPAGKCVVFPCYYLRVIFRKKKLKKLNLTTISLNDTIKVNNKESDLPTNNHVVNISTISDTVEENYDTK